MYLGKKKKKKSPCGDMWNIPLFKPSKCEEFQNIQNKITMPCGIFKGIFILFF